MNFRKHWLYFKKVIKHKTWVFIYCLKLKVPLHLAICHDISKFSKDQWNPFVNYYYGGNKNTSDVYTKFGIALVHHYNSNKHHWEYWTHAWPDGSFSRIDIPEKYIREMLADWAGAGKVYSGKADVLNWYALNKNSIYITDKTRKKLERLLNEYFA